MHSHKQAIIIGAGPAGLTAAYELLEQTEVKISVFEESSHIGGLSKTVLYNGNRIDIGGHRFFSKNKKIMSWWFNILQLQGYASKYDLLSDHTTKEFNQNGQNPDHSDKVMLIRSRISRIFYGRKFFDYPISMNLDTFKNLGFINIIKAGSGYMYSSIFRKKENSLENFYINRFGKPLYKMFFEDYTQKVWGIHPANLGADWGTQRVKGLSIITVIKEMLRKQLHSDTINSKKTETSLIRQFYYPKYGPGQMWETVADKIQQKGGSVQCNAKVEHIHVENNRVVAVSIKEHCELKRISCDYLISSMPLKDLIASLKGIEVSSDVTEISQNLPYRDFITVGLLCDKLLIENNTKTKSYANRIPDNWIYIQDCDVKIGRLQIFNNWSPYMVSDYKNKVWIGLEYFCNENDVMWQMDDSSFIEMAKNELEKIKIINKSDVVDAVRIKVKKAYPSYYGSYYKLDKVKDFLNQIENLYCIGRNGQHRYNNMDHSMLSAMESVDNIRTGRIDKNNIWAINTEDDYQEEH